MNPTKKDESIQMSQNQSRFISFSLDQEDYAIPLLAVKEVIGLPDITKIPFTPSHFLGIMNLRGQVISVIDLRLKFNLKAATNTESVVIICDLKPLCIGIVVNSVNRVLSLAQEDISAPPEIQSTKSTEYIMGVTRKDKKLILLLDIAKALDVNDQVAIQKSLEFKIAA